VKLNTGRAIFSDRYTIVLTIAVLLLIIFILFIYISINKQQKANKMLTEQLREITTMQKEFLYIKDRVVSREKKVGIVKTTGIVSATEQMLDTLGLKAKIIKPLEKKKIKEFTVEDAELLIEETDLNAIVNLLYKLENSPLPLKIKNVDMKTTFENPNKFILNITLSLVTRA